MALQAMNASPYHPKVKTSIRLGDSLYVAGGVVAGKMQMECKADKGLGIGIIMVELYAIEELTSRDHSATSTFLQSRRVFQGPGLPPSNSVHPHPLVGEPPLPLDYYPARRGTTTFLFRFELPPSSPSAINFGSSLANIRYEVRASVGVSWKGERRVVTDKKEVDVVERFEEDYTRGDPEGVVVGESGKMWVQGKLVGGFLVAGQPACVELQVKNHSPKKNSGLSITLTRELRLPHFPVTEKAPLRISDTLTSVSFRGQDYVIQSGTEGVANLVFDVPAGSRGVKGGLRYGDEQEERVTECLFEVRCIVSIKLTMGFGSKDIQLDIPVNVLHPLALPELLPSEPYLPPQSPMPYNLSGQTPYALPISPEPYFSPQLRPLPPMSPVNPYIEQGYPGWLPPLVQSPIQHNIPMSPPLPDPWLYYNMPPHGLLPSPHTPVYPLRPSSAEPIPSHALYAMPSGVPVPPMQQPLLPLARSDPPPLSDREEGKGERASRIAHHLRMSSRHRSVSPQAHRYPVPIAIESHATGQLIHRTPSPHQEAAASLPVAIPLPSSPMLLTVPTGLSMSSDVVSPKPLLSPKQTYTVDPFTHATLAKSERVETLERIAAHAERKFSDMSNNVPEVMNLGMIDKEKTLPTPPVPSGKVKILSGLAGSRPAAQTLFLTVESAEKAPPTPTLAAVASLKVPRVDGPLSGLDALEARLLAEVGTRKIDTDDKRPDVRSVLPISIPKPQGDPANDSAISSLNLPGLGADEMTKIGKSNSAHSAGTYRDGQRGRSRERDRGKTKEPSDATVTREKKRKKERQGEAPRDEDAYRLRKAAQGRIAAWLDTIDPDAPSSPVITRRSTPHDEDREPPTPAIEAHEPPSEQGERYDTPPSQRAPPEESNVGIGDVDAQPNPRSSGFVPIGTLHANRKDPPASKPEDANGIVKLPSNLQKYLPVYPPRSLDPEVRYDVRSARGGRGGKVTAVAAIWASATQATGPPSQTPGPPVPAKVLKSSPLATKPVAGKKPIPAVSPPRTTERLPARLPNTHGSPNLAAKRAKAVKSASVPAVISSSLATPMLSSTASLARAPAPTTDRTRFKAQVSSGITEIREGVPIVSPKPVSAAKGETAFGQARLKELIKKYQGQANA